MTRRLYLFSFLLTSIFSYPPLPAAAGPELGTLTGTVTDKADGKPISGATIAIPDMKTGTVTDGNGKFSITLATKGIHLVEVSYVGYATFNQNVDFAVVSHL
jgi:iron complex outermembrane receptor protein